MPATPKHLMTTRAQQKARQQRQDAKARKACVDAVWARAGGRCEVCRMALQRPRDASSVMFAGHVHEKVTRAKGGSAHDPDNCVLLCVQDHGRAHGLRYGQAS